MDELTKVAKECPSEGKAQEQEGAWQCRWCGMTEEVKREAGYTGGGGPGWGRP